MKILNEIAMMVFAGLVVFAPLHYLLWAPHSHHTPAHLFHHVVFMLLALVGFLYTAHYGTREEVK